MGKFVDLTGMQFERLKVLYRTDDYVSPSGNHVAQWHCQCSCDNKTELDVVGSSLKRGLTKSCGCLQKEIVSKIGKKTIHINGLRTKKYNEYDLDTYDYGIGWASNTNKQFIFDKDDFDLIKDKCWRENKTSGYIVTATNSKTNIALHRLVMNCPEGKYIDHINRNRTDNRKSNLRFSTLQENNYNKDNKNNCSSGHKGVSWNKRMNKWETYIFKNKKKILLGYFINLDEAIKVREKAEIQYFGNFSYEVSNSISKQIE